MNYNGGTFIDLFRIKILFLKKIAKIKEGKWFI